MSASAPSLSRSWAVGRYTASLDVGPLAGGVVNAVVTWTPHLPNDLTPDEVQAYRRGRDEAFRDLGLAALICDL